MEPEFNKLPYDAQVELMKNKPYFRRLNKTYYKHGKIPFEQKYCNIDISINELINYINDDVEEFAVFYINDEIITMNVYIKDGDEYTVISRDMYYDNVDMGEYKLTSDHNETVKDIDTIVETLEQKNMYLDIKTVQHIIAKRGCNNAKEFSVNYLNDIMSKSSGGDMGALFIQFVKIFYFTTSYDIIKGYYKNVSYNADDIKFDEMGNVFKDNKDMYEQDLENSESYVNIYYDKIMVWLEK